MECTHTLSIHFSINFQWSSPNSESICRHSLSIRITQGTRCYTLVHWFFSKLVGKDLSDLAIHNHGLTGFVKAQSGSHAQNTVAGAHEPPKVANACPTPVALAKHLLSNSRVYSFIIYGCMRNHTCALALYSIYVHAWLL